MSNLNNIVICNAKKKSKHCLTKCPHGRHHIKETGSESCNIPQFCSLSLSGIRKMVCKPLSKQAQKEYIKNGLND